MMTLSAVFPSNVPAKAAETVWWAEGSEAVSKSECSVAHTYGNTLSKFVFAREFKAIMILKCFRLCSYLFMYTVVSICRLALADHSFPWGCFLIVNFTISTLDVCVSSHLTSLTLVSQLLIISAAPTDEAASCLTLMIWAFQIWML